MGAGAMISMHRWTVNRSNATLIDLYGFRRLNDKSPRSPPIVYLSMHLFFSHLLQYERAAYKSRIVIRTRIPPIQLCGLICELKSPKTSPQMIQKRKGNSSSSRTDAGRQLIKCYLQNVVQGETWCRSFCLSFHLSRNFNSRSASYPYTYIYIYMHCVFVPRNYLNEPAAQHTHTQRTNTAPDKETSRSHC